MKVAALLAATAGLASAFMPAPVLPKAATFKRGGPMMSVQDMIGIDVETGGLFDPLGFSKDESSLFRYRCVELKHGRVAMLAILGQLVQLNTHLPDEVFSNPRPLGALNQLLAERPLAIVQIVLAIAALELTAGAQDFENKAPGELGRFGEAFKPEGEEEFKALQLKELKNGRLAMVASIGGLVQESLTGQGPIEQIFAGHISPFGDGQGLF